MNQRRIISFAMLVIMLFAMAIPTMAVDNGITPRYNNTDTTEAVFVIRDDGETIISFACFGYEGITTRIVVETKIQKKFLWWWNDVDGASWTDESNRDYCDAEHSFQLSKSGTYKAVITYNVYGTGGEADIFTREIEKKY
ncbi:MAG: hypothetical protein IKA02_04660 [Clostridia bacterium]|nr:hypothetical protein [Clostridia bacterium]